jgi:hypothetical protein
MGSEHGTYTTYRRKHCLSCPHRAGEEEVSALFDKLSQGAKIEQPLTKAFFWMVWFIGRQIR